MKVPPQWIVVTTVNHPTEAIKKVSALCKGAWNAVAVGDTKTPADWNADGINYLSIDGQRSHFDGLSDLIPVRHYARKNLGYLYAAQRGAQRILETDDDNIPGDRFGREHSLRVSGYGLEQPGWINIYRYFSDRFIWPRGFPLDEICAPAPQTGPVVHRDCPVQQFLADGDPDVDAIYRLLYKDAVMFDPDAGPFVLGPGAWCPFNSQNTLFFRQAFPLLYLPSHVSFRMTDIMRSMIAQMALWIHEERLAFHGPTVSQERNVHDLMQDFYDEVPVYLQMKKISRSLEDTREQHSQWPSMSVTARTLWKGLIRDNLLPENELPILETWYDAMDAAMGNESAVKISPGQEY